MSSQNTTKPGGLLAGATGLLMVACCLAGPAVIGAAAGASIGGLLGVGTAVVVAITVSIVLAMRRRRRSDPNGGGSGCGC